MKHDDELIVCVASALKQKLSARIFLYWTECTEMAQAALDAAFQWRDISTAPRGDVHPYTVTHGDEVAATFILLSNMKHVGVGYCVKDPDFEEIWWGEDGVEIRPAPTHWLPLPPAPEE